VQKAQGAGSGAVLIVDHTVQMSTIGERDQPARGGEVAIPPGPQMQGCGHRRGRGREFAAQLPLHEDARIGLETMTREYLTELSLGMQQKLRLDPAGARGALQQLQRVLQQPRLDAVRTFPCLGGGKDISDHRLVLLIHAEDVTCGLAIFCRNKAGQDARIQVIEQELRRCPVVPAQTPLPQFGLLGQECTQRRSSKMTQVEHILANHRASGQ
jgi:hypothetical protein